jgi:replicative DNA helicase
VPGYTDISPFSQLMRRIDARADGAPAADTVAAGFPSIDVMLGGGFRTGDLIVLGGDVGSGKSAFGLAVALRAALAATPVVYYTGEMSVERVLERMLALEGRARIDDLRRGALDEAARASVGAAAVRLRDLSPIAQRLPPDVDGLRDALAGRPDVRLVVVDSLQALASGQGAPDEGLATAVRDLKTVAVERGLALLLIAHLPDLPRDRPDMRPTLDDFGVRHAVKQHADIVLGLFREEMYQAAQGVDGATELLALKNRNGPTAYVDLFFYKQWMRFEDLMER